MPDTKDKRVHFDPPIVLTVMTPGQIMSCTVEGAFKQAADIKTAHIDTLPALLALSGVIGRGEAKCIVSAEGQVVEIPLGMALYLESLDYAGRLKMKDVPASGDSTTATKHP